MTSFPIIRLQRTSPDGFASKSPLALKTADTTSFLFSDDSSSEGGLSGAKAAETGTGNGGGNPPGKKIEEMTYEDFVKQETQGQ